MPAGQHDAGSAAETPELAPATARVRRAGAVSVAFGALVLVSMFGWAVAESAVDARLQIAIDLALPLLLIAGAAVVTTNRRRAVVDVERVKLAAAEERATRDDLSGLYNLRHLRECLSSEIADAAREADRPLAQVSVDLDDFKEINDRLGHLAGDEVIVAAGRAVAHVVGARGIAARPGGDEFAVLLPGCDRASAAALAIEIAAAIEDASLRATPRNANIRIGACWGLAMYPEDGADAESLTAAADRAMYRAKSERQHARARTAERNSQDVLFAIGDAIGRSLDPSDVVRNFCSAVAGSLAVDMCGIWEIQENGAVVMMTAHVSADRAEVAQRLSALTPITRAEAEESGLLRRRPVYLDDAASAPELPERYRSLMPPRTWFIVAPVPALHGRLLAMSAAHDRAAPPETGLVLAIARLAAASLTNADAYQRAQRRAEQLAALAGIGGLLFGEGEYEDRLGAVVRRIVEVTGYSSVTIDTEDPAGLRPFCRNVFGYDSDGVEYDEAGKNAWRAMRPALREPNVAEFLRRTNKPVIMDDPLNQVPPDYRRVIENAGIRSVGIVPIVWDDELKGMLYFASYRANAFGAEDIAMIHALAAQLGPSIQVMALHQALETSYAELKDAHLHALLRLAYAAEARDPYTECHLQRIRAVAQAIAQRMGVEGDELEALGYGAVVHDLGKLRIPDSILMNPGSLSDDEWAQMKRHPEWGAEIIGDNAFYDVARQVALCHHERWDGSGYPRGLAGEEIPLAARVVSVADVYDALTSARSYKAAWAPERALVELMRLPGKTLCPRSVDVFMELWREGEIGRIDDATAEDSMEVDFRQFYAA